VIALLLAQLLTGDVRNARGLIALHCAACHEGSDRYHAPSLNDPALIASRTDDQLTALLLKGTDSHPAKFGFSLLDAADLAAYLRAGLPSVIDCFPDAAAYTAKAFTLSGPAENRAETLVGEELKAAERTVTVFSVYGGPQPPTGPRLVPQDPVLLDQLSPKSKRGYVVFGWLDGKPLAMALTTELQVLHLVSPAAAAAKAAPAVVGKGDRAPGRRRPFVSKSAPEAARELTRLYARAAEAASLAAKEEADRHLFDAPGTTK
jgi:hypothetical protein